MIHPTREQLLSYLEGDDSAKALQTHIDGCSQCKAELKGWKLTIRDLEAYEVPKTQEAARPWSVGILKWAVAAMVVLAFGFGVGRLSARDSAKFKDRIVAEVTHQVQEQLRADLLAAAKQEPPANNRFLAQLHAELSEFSTIHDADNERRVDALENLVQSVKQTQEADQRHFIRWLQEVQQQQQIDYVSLHRDLETAVTMADRDLKQHQERLSELAATLAPVNN